MAKQPWEEDEIVGASPWEQDEVVADSSSVPKQQPERKSYGQQLGEYWTKDLPEAGKGIVDRTLQRSARIEAPTELGLAAQSATGAKGVAGQVVEGIAGTPERLGRAVGGALGTITDAVGTLGSLGASGLNRYMGGIPGRILEPVKEGAQNLVKGALESKLAQGIGKAYSELPEASKANLGATGDALTAVGGLGLGLSVKKPLVEMRNAAEQMRGPISHAAKELATNQSGAVRIPDLDELAEAVGMESSQSVGAQAKKEIKQIEKAIPSKPAFSRISDQDATILSEPIGPNDTDFNQYAVQAKKSSVNKRELTPMDMAGKKAVDALNDISATRRKIGAQMEDVLNNAQKEQVARGIFISTGEIKQRAKDVIREYTGYDIDDTGKLVAAEGRLPKASGEAALIKKIWNQVDQLDNGATFKELADLNTSLRNTVDNYKASFAKPINTIAEGAGKQIQGEIDRILKGFAGDEYTQLSKDYGNIKRIEKELSRRLGEVSGEGTARMGASLLKSAVQSNSDRGSKALFKAVKDVTGYDLIKDAAYAEIAMRAVDDPRVLNLLEEAGIARKALSGDKVGAVVKLGEKAIDITRGDKLTEAINYYNRQQKRAGR